MLSFQSPTTKTSNSFTGALNDAAARVRHRIVAGNVRVVAARSRTAATALIVAPVGTPGALARFRLGVRLGAFGRDVEATAQTEEDAARFLTKKKFFFIFAIYKYFFLIF